MRNLLSNSLKVCAFVLSILLSAQAFAQTVQQSQLDCTPAQAHCTSKDLSVVDVYVDLPPCAPCSSGTVTAPLIMVIHNGTKSERSAFALWGTLSSGASINGVFGNIFVCVGAITVKSDQNLGYGLGNQAFTVGNIQFNCGQSLTLTNNLMAWTAANGSTSSACTAFAGATTCASIEPKCGDAASIQIRQPLTATSSSGTSCSNSATGSVTVTVTTGAGTAPYIIAIDGTTFSAGSSRTKTPLAAGNYNWSVTDAAGCTTSGTQTVSSQFCCTAPTVNADPASTDACPAGTASFTAGATGGDPTPTVQWWKKGPNDANFSSVTNTGVYSGATTTTLNISNVNGLHNFQYKAIFTSAGCTPDESLPATLTVKTPPAAPTTIYHPPACDKTTFSVEVTNVVNGATYTIKKGDGSSFAALVVTPSDAISATSTANITFSNIPAGSGFQVSVSENGCSPAGVGSCSTATVGTPATARITTTTAAIEFAEESQTSVKAYPNPFSDRVKFMVTSSVAGNGNLEVYNMMGQKVKTVYQGYIMKGTQTFELSLPSQSVGNLVYVLRIGDKKMTGKILQINR